MFFCFTQYNKMANKYLNTIWTGKLDYLNSTGEAAYKSALPFYFGLMAIAGAILLSVNNKKQE